MKQIFSTDYPEVGRLVVLTDYQSMILRIERAGREVEERVFTGEDMVEAVMGEYESILRDNVLTLFVG